MSVTAAARVYTVGMWRVILSCSLVVLASFPARGQEGTTRVYRTVNEQGVVEFSDTPPAEGVAVRQLEIAPIQPVDPAQVRADLEALRETTDRLVAERSAREAQRSPVVVLAPPSPAPADDGPGEIRQGVYLPPVYYPFRHPPRPPHPPLRPRALPDWDRNSQLMRPITEQRLREREGRR
ncbi:DUF4124 domain-containing protein [Haliea atlantica]